jgi:hypothetical protein
VIQNIQSVRIDGNEPVDVQFYSGPDRAEAIVAMAQAALHSDPEWVTLRSVRMEVVECVWERNQYQPWARLACSGKVVKTYRGDMAGLLCDAHRAAWDALSEGEYWRSQSMVPAPDSFDCETNDYSLSDCVWWDQPHPRGYASPFLALWANAECSGRVGDSVRDGQSGIMCEAHYNAYPKP